MNLGFKYLLVLVLVLLVLIVVTQFLKQTHKGQQVVKPPAIDKPPAIGKPPAPPLLCLPSYWGNVPNPLNCSSFYMCVSGRPMYRECTTGAVFNEELRACVTVRSDEERAIVCGNRPF
jgi:Chitin binding Peritrophin-A domain